LDAVVRQRQSLPKTNKTQMDTLMTAITIERFDTQIVDLPTIRPHKLAMHTMHGQTLVILRIYCSDGIVGVGEATTIGGLAYAGESPESIKVNLDTWFAPLLIGQDASNLNAAMGRVDRAIRGNTFARSAVETALLDALGKRLGLPVAEVLGGRVRDGVEVAWTLASGDTHKDIEEAERMLDIRRHRHFKLKIGAGEPTRDIAHVAAIKRVLGDRASVRVDINQAWSEAVAVRACRLLADEGVELIEQPLSRHDRAGMVRLSAHSPIPLMADEAIESVQDSFALAQMGAASIFALKIAKTGGPLAVLRTAAIAQAAGIGLYGGTMLEGSVGTLAAAHAFATLDRLEWHTELFGPLLLTEDILVEPPVYRDFQLMIPRTPGLGLELDDERLARFARR
jgi:muconate cycloisomerase